MLKKILALFSSLFFLSSCEQIAIKITPAKAARYSHAPDALTAKKTFWTVLHGGQYNKITPTLEMLTAAYLNHPDDPDLAAYTGFLHIWKIAERQRLQTNNPLIVNQMILANKYFNAALQLAPNDPRIEGFAAVSQLSMGAIFANDREQVRGYFALKRSINSWPQFNYFTAGYPMSILPYDSKHFKEGLEWQWQTLNICAHTKINHNNPSYAPFMKLATTTGRDRVCWNSWIAPFNFEGFFLNMGDMLVKQGDYQTAIKIYNNAKLASNYSKWPYRFILENRISQAQNNVNNFRRTSPFNTTEKSPEKTIAFNAKFSCMMCHQENGH